jgi:hypothetical protein
LGLRKNLDVTALPKSDIIESLSLFCDSFRGLEEICSL